MKRWLLASGLLLACVGARGAWPFESDKDRPPRVSELVEPASVMIDEAYDLASDGKTSEAVARYRAALAELERIEAENSDRVQTPEFNTVKNKRATVLAAIDSLLLSEAQNNAKAIAVTDTTELQKKYDARRAAEKSESAPVGRPVEKPVAKPAEGVAGAREQMSRRDYAGAQATLAKVLGEKPNDDAALNLLAVAQLADGLSDAAEKTLTRALRANPGSYYAYYNMSRLQMRVRHNVAAAKLYYERGRKVGGPVDPKLEGLFR